MGAQTLSKTEHRRRPRGDVHVGSSASDVPPAPGAGTDESSETVEAIVEQPLDKVRRHIRERSRRHAGP